MRSTWTGFIQFGMVSIPVKQYTAVRDDDIKFKMVTAEGGTVRQVLVTDGVDKKGNPIDKPVDRDTLKKGYEVAPGEFVIINPDELTQMQPASSKTIAIERFLNSPGEIPAMLYQKWYYLGPAKGGEGPFSLFARAIGGRVGMGSVAMRNRTYNVAVMAGPDGTLLMSTLGDPKCIVPPEAVPTQDAEPAPELVEVGRSLVNAMVGHFDPDDLTDGYKESVRRLVEAKLEGLEISEREEAAPNLVDDLMATLSASLDAHKKSKGPKVVAPKRKAKA